jgi:alpha-glucan, water dikinase
MHNSGLERWSYAWSQLAVAVLDNVALSVASVLDTICTLVQSPADIFASSVSTVDQKYVANFGEEVARGHPLYVVSPLLQKLGSDCRNAAGLGPWELVASGAGSEPSYGRVVVKNLADMQGQSAITSAGETAIVLSADLGGLEDIPNGVVAVLTASPVDLLSHIAIRARNSNVLLASCADMGVWQETVAAHNGQLAAVSAGPGSGDLTMEAVDAGHAGMAAITETAVSGVVAATQGSLRLARPDRTDAWAIVPHEFREGLVGGKSLGLKQLAMLAGEDFLVPPAFAVPYGSFERALASSPNGVQRSFAEACSKLAAAAPAGAQNLDMKIISAALAEVRAAVMQVRLPEGLRGEIAAAVAGQGGSLEAWGAITDDIPGAMDDPTSVSAQGAGAWRALKAVWASKWTERAFLQRCSAGIPDDDLSMAVLCMGLVPAEYAFVLHTQSPITGGSQDDVYGEVVVGLGETLVGNHPGRAFAFKVSKTTGQMSLLSLPSKLDVQYAPEKPVCLIARSDSNGEDLEGFAGAGVIELAHHLPPWAPCS